MKPEQIAVLEHVVWLVSFVAMTAAVTAFDWRIGLFFGGALLAASNLDVSRWRR